MSDLYEKIYDVVRQIPQGRVTSYGAIAEYLGSKGGARMVGWALNKALKQTEYVPAHRVLNREGRLTGKVHFRGENLMQELLESEGLCIIDDQVQDFEKVFWNPITELHHL